MVTLQEVSRKILNLLETEKLDYLIMGGLATSIIGEARMTQDIDILIFIGKDNIVQLLNAAKKIGFRFNKKKLDEDINLRGIFQLTYGSFHVDFICGAMPFELEAVKRKQKLPLYGMKVSFPTPEDLILFKLIPAREKDLLDAKGIITRHKGKLDFAYLRKWVNVIAEDLQDLRIVRRLEEVIRKN